jgi:pyroglutamyl-peptidase
MAPAAATREGAMYRVLLTSFEPFGGHGKNSSFEVGRAVAQYPPAGVELTWLTLPVVGQTCIEPPWRHIEQHSADVVIALGQAAGATVVRLEDRAINLDDFPIPDNAGRQPRLEWIVPGAPPARRTTARLDRILAALRVRGIAHEHSFHAGLYVCNHLYYHLLHRAAEAGLAHQTLFVHLPLLPEQVPAGVRFPSQPLALLARAVACVVEACCLRA